jgi:hypothetical protein
MFILQWLINKSVITRVLTGNPEDIWDNVRKDGTIESAVCTGYVTIPVTINLYVVCRDDKLKDLYKLLDNLDK